MSRQKKTGPDCGGLEEAVPCGPDSIHISHPNAVSFITVLLASESPERLVKALIAWRAHLKLLT